MMFYTASTLSEVKCPFVERRDFLLLLRISLNFYRFENIELPKNPSATFFSCVSEDAMQDIGLGDLLVIGKSLEVIDSKIAVCYIDAEFPLKKVKLEKDYRWLVPY